MVRREIDNNNVKQNKTEQNVCGKKYSTLALLGKSE